MIKRFPVIVPADNAGEKKIKCHLFGKLSKWRRPTTVISGDLEKKIDGPCDSN